MKKSHESVVGAALRVRTRARNANRPTDRPTGDSSADADLPNETKRNETKRNETKRQEVRSLGSSSTHLNDSSPSAVTWNV